METLKSCAQRVIYHHLDTSSGPGKVFHVIVVVLPGFGISFCSIDGNDFDTWTFYPGHSSLYLV